MPFDQAYQDAKSAIDEFNKEYEGTQFGPAGMAASNGINEFAKAQAAFQKGDTIGGAVGVLRGLGALSGVLTMTGPAGAAFSALLGALTSLIASIMEAMRPASESLEAKLEKLIVKEDLRTAYENMVGKKEEWKQAEDNIAGLADARKEASEALVKGGEGLSAAQKAKYEEVAAGVTMTQINQETRWETHYGGIVTALTKLKDTSDYHLKEWMPLFDITITYTLRFWLLFESMGGLIIDGIGDDHINGKKTFANKRKDVASTLFNNVLAIYFDSLNEVDFYALWLSNSSWWDTENTARNSPYGSATYNSMQHRIGVTGGGSYDDSGNSSNNFAVSTSGTIFSAESPYSLYVGRLGTEWQKVEGAPESRLVFIGEMPHDQVVVVCIHPHGHQISFSGFHDDPDPSQWKWGPWNTYDIPDQMEVLSLAVKPAPPYWGLYAFAKDKDGGGALYDVRLPGGTNTAKMNIIPETKFDSSVLRGMLYDFDPNNHWSSLNPCTVSCPGDSIFVQVGHEVRILDSGKWVTWQLRSQLDHLGLGSNLQVWQARPFADGTFVIATNKGMIMRYSDPLNNWDKSDKVDKAAQTLWFWKGVSRQAGATHVLVEMLAVAGGLAPIRP